MKEVLRYKKMQLMEYEKILILPELASQRYSLVLVCLEVTKEAAMISTGAGNGE